MSIKLHVAFGIALAAVLFAWWFVAEYRAFTPAILAKAEGKFSVNCYAADYVSWPATFKLRRAGYTMSDDGSAWQSPGGVCSMRLTSGTTARKAQP